MKPIAQTMRQHFLALDGVRGMAILLVLCYHLINTSHGLHGKLMDTLTLVPKGLWVGVDLFFVLSGFLITGILYDSLKDVGYFRKFYGRRALRIFPLYYGLILFLFLFTRPFHLVWQHMPAALLLYLQNTSLIQPIFHYDPSDQVHLSHLWSLAVEEQFYLVWPLVVFWLRDLRRLVIAALTGAAIALILRIFLTWHGTDLATIYVSTPLRADSLLIGSALALGLRSAARERILGWANYMMLFGVLGTLAVILHDHQLSFSYGYLVPSVEFTFLAIASAGLVASCFRENSLARPFFEARWLRFLGKYSYGIYVFHFPLDSWLTVPVRDFGHSLHVPRALGVLLTSAFVGVVSILAAYVSFNLFEKHFLRFKTYFEYDAQAKTGTS